MATTINIEALDLAVDLFVLAIQSEIKPDFSACLEKALELQFEHQQAYQAVQEARYALINGNLDNKPVPISAIKEWLDVIERSLT